MPIKFDYVFVYNYFKQNSYTLLSKEYNGQKDVVIYCDKEKYLYETSFSSFQLAMKRNSKPHKFYNGNPNTEYNIRNWLYLNNHPFVLLDNQKFNKNNEILYFKCLNCSIEEEPFAIPWAQMYYRYSCPICSNRKAGKFNNLEYKRNDLMIYWDYDKNEKNPSEYTEHSEQRVWWKCDDCGISSFCRISDRTDKGSGCPNCNTSKGELKIKTFLKRINVFYIIQHKFSDCKNKKELPFDFYIPDYNLCIEYDGELHFETFGHSFKKESIEKLKQTQKRDKIKTKYCKDNNINLLRIPYWEFDNIEKILTETLL